MKYKQLLMKKACAALDEAKKQEEKKRLTWKPVLLRL
jgi:hypothetical protein